MTISNLDGQNDWMESNSNTLHDPCPNFCGVRLKNEEGYICYLNCVMNGLLSLKTFRKLIPFMKEDIQNILCGVLNNDLHDLEQLRSKLHSFCVENATGSFPRSTHSDPVEALTRLIEMINMAHLHQETLVDIKLH